LPTKEEHVTKAAANEQLALSLNHDTQAKIDWTLVILFYSGVHYVEAYLAKFLNAHLRSHTTRDSYLGRESNLKKIYSAYQHLKYYGYNARYEVCGFTSADAKDAAKDARDG
jgi:hypothetical protein